MHHARRSPHADGQGIAEFALILPIFLALLFAVLDMGRVIWATDDLRAAAREAARYAAVHGGWEMNGCPTGPNLAGSAPTGCSAWSPDSKEPTRVVARQWLKGGGAALVVQVCYYAASVSATPAPSATPVPSGQLQNDCSGDVDQTGAANGRGAFVKVTVKSTLTLVTGSFLGFSPFAIQGTSTTIISN